MPKARPPKIDMKKKRLTLVSLHNTPSTAAVRNPTAAITARGGLIAKTRKPA